MNAPERTAAPLSSGAFVAFGYRDFRLFWGGAFISNIGTWMQTVAQGWLVLELTDSAFMLGLVGFASTVPMLVLLLLGGVFADRVDRRVLLLWLMAAMMTFAGVLTVVTWLGVVTVWHIIILSLLSGAGIAIAAPAYQAFVHDLVDRSDLQNAIALNSTQFNLSRVVGPSLAGLVVGAIGLAGSFGVNTISYIAAIVTLTLIKVARRPAPNPAPVWESLMAGVTYARKRPRVQTLLGLTAAISILAMPYSTLLPIIARDVLDLDASGLGFLFAVGGVGAVAGAMSLTIRSLYRYRGIYLLGCATVTGLGTMALGLSRTPVVAAISLVVISFTATTSIALMNTLLQELVDDEMRGRVLSMYGLAFMGTFPIGNLLAGTLAEVLTASTTLAITGAALAVCVTLIAATRPQLREIA